MKTASKKAKGNKDIRTGRHELRDFSITLRVLPIAAISILLGLCSTGLAWVLLKLIGFFTNLFYYQRLDTSLISPAGNHLGWAAALVPVLGGLIVGVMARYGSHKIRGHGIPEALESILMNGSRVEPKLAILKPISAGIAIGSGGPFGAEGPIIMTGGAFGSLVAQCFHLTSAERKTLLVAGAAAGMAAVFSAPISAILLAVELMLFEFKPRSIIPVALASLVAGFSRRFLLGSGPLFPTIPHSSSIDLPTLLGCAVCGLLAGVFAALLSKSIYAVEDGFSKLPIHWMWWPAIGAVVVGVGGLIFPRALGVGYDVIGDMLQGRATMTLFIGILIVKSLMWIASLGSGTSGGILAPILMIGGALGGIEALYFPQNGAGFWPLISMAGVLGGAIEAPFTAIVFAVELTNDFNMALPLAVGCFVAYAFTTLTLNRSILTEKVARRGYHLNREYGVDPLSAFLVKEVMRTKVRLFRLSSTIDNLECAEIIASRKDRQNFFPVVDGSRTLVAFTTRSRLRASAQSAHRTTIADIANTEPVVAHPNEPLLNVVHRMVDTGYTRFPVVSAAGEILGLIALEDMLQARVNTLGQERDRERPLRFPFGNPTAHRPAVDQAEAVERAS